MAQLMAFLLWNIILIRCQGCFQYFNEYRCIYIRIIRLQWPYDS